MANGIILERLMLLVPLVLSLTVHEWAHAYAAYRLGDDTAQRQGRLTLDPLAHIDFLGTLVLPMLGIPFGWAKPVPIDPLRFRRSVSMRMGIWLTAAAGPLSNALIALVCAVACGLLLRFARELVWSSAALPTLLFSTITMNVMLAVFNMLPIPPLDGSRVIDSIVPARFEKLWEGFCRFAPLALLFIIVAPSTLHFSIIAWPVTQVTRLVSRFILLLGGSDGFNPVDALRPENTVRLLAAVSLQAFRSRPPWGGKAA